MSTVTIDNIEYVYDSLSTEAKEELESMNLCDQKIADLRRDLGIATTARNAYAGALRNLLLNPAPEIKPKPKPKVKAKAKKA
jgi:hypothetical protein